MKVSNALISLITLLHYKLCNALVSNINVKLLPSSTVESSSSWDQRSSSTTTQLHMVPRYDKSSGKWFGTKPEDSEGYGPLGSLLRAGPKPFLQRIFLSDAYDQAVFKYMAQEGCDRNEAQGNMDAYLENPNDWTYYKLQEKDGKLKRDWANVNTDPKQIALSLAWSGVVIWFFYTFISDCLAGKYAN